MINGNGAHHISTNALASPVRWKDTVPESLRPVRVENIAMLMECWPYVRPRLAWIKEKDKSCGNWTPEHVRFYIQEGLLNPTIRFPVELYLALDERAMIHGFLAGSVVVDPYINVPLKYHIWALWLNRAGINKLLPWFEDMVRQRGLTAIDFETGRLGWMGVTRKLMRSGFYCHLYTFRKEIPA